MCAMMPSVVVPRNSRLVYLLYSYINEFQQFWTYIRTRVAQSLRCDLVTLSGRAVWIFRDLLETFFYPRQLKALSSSTVRTRQGIFAFLSIFCLQFIISCTPSKFVFVLKTCLVPSVNFIPWHHLSIFASSTCTAVVVSSRCARLCCTPTSCSIYHLV